MVWLLISCSFPLALPGIAQAQVSASIVGTVTDATGASVKDAKVTVKSVDTGATREASTDDAGSFRFLALPLGPQEVRAKKDGFKPLVRNGINLEVGQEAVVNLRLDVGNM